MPHLPRLGFLGGLSVLLAAWLGAEPLAVVDQYQALTQAAATAPDAAAAARTPFVAAYFADRATADTYDATLPYENPPAWGKTLSPQTGGTVDYRKSFAGGFVCRLALHGLAPEHTYILTLNGNPQRAGNALLRDRVPGMEQERYYDFLKVNTDAAGEYRAEFGIALKPGAYDVRLYVKDTTDFKIVLYRDFFPFTVK